jgi:hypothetical protein
MTLFFFHPGPCSQRLLSYNFTGFFALDEPVGGIKPRALDVLSQCSAHIQIQPVVLKPKIHSKEANDFGTMGPLGAGNLKQNAQVGVGGEKGKI